MHKKMFIVIPVSFLYGCASPSIKATQSEPLPAGLKIIQDAPIIQCVPAAIKYNERSTQLDLTCK